jgi:hypothetical protein
MFIISHIPQAYRHYYKFLHLRLTAIADLAAREDKPLDGFGIFGVVKEVAVDDEGISRICIFSYHILASGSQINRSVLNFLIDVQIIFRLARISIQLLSLSAVS